MLLPYSNVFQQMIVATYILTYFQKPSWNGFDSAKTVTPTEKERRT